MTHRRADLTLVLITIIWGTTFPIVHGATQGYPPLSLLAWRFLLGALGIAPLALRQSRKEPNFEPQEAQSPQEGEKYYIHFSVSSVSLWFKNPLRIPRHPLTRVPAVVNFNTQLWLVALALGMTLFAGFALQTLGLRLTTSSRGGFITGLNVLLVPLLALLLLRQRPAPRALAGLALALAGMALLTLDSPEGLSLAGLNRGDLLVLLCAVAFALHIVLVARLAATLPAVQLNAAQMVVVAALALGAALLVDGFPAPSPPLLASAAFLGLVATALVFALQIAAQRHTTPTHTALIFALEPVFAALFSALAGETIGRWTLLGGAIMVLGVVVAEVGGADEGDAA